MNDGRSEIWMLATSPDGKGGIASVIQQYRAAGFFDKGSIHFEPTHHDKSRTGRFFPFLCCSVKLWSALVFRQVSLIHAHSSFGGSFWRKLLLVMPAFGLAIPVIVHLHGSKFMEFHSEGGRWRQFWIRFLFRRSFCVIALSDEWKQWVLRVEPRSKVDVVFNSLARTTGKDTAESMDVRPTVLFLGRIGERKGTFDLLGAFAQARLRVPSARLLVGGDGDVERFIAEAENLGITDGVSYIGWAGAAQKSSLFQDAWVFALPSYQEGLPMAILEAMAFSRAVISCPVGGIPQAVEHGINGYLVPPGNVAALADCLGRVFSDRELAIQMGRAARLSFETKFSHEAAWPALFAIYREAGISNVPSLGTKAAAHD